MPSACPTAGCACVNFKPDAFKKEKCCNCFHNHSADGSTKAAAQKAPGPPAVKKPATPASPPSETKSVRPPLEAQKSSEKSVAFKVAEGKKAPGPPDSGKLLKIAWHQNIRSETYQIDTTDIQNLEQLDVRLRSAEASLAGKRFDYLCRGQVVVKAFWDIFKPEHLSPTLFIQEVDATADRTRFKAPMPGAPAEKKTGFVAPSSSTGFAAPTKVTFQKPVVKVAAVAPGPAAGGKPAVFKADEGWFAGRPPLFA